MEVLLLGHKEVTELRIEVFDSDFLITGPTDMLLVLIFTYMKPLQR